MEVGLVEVVCVAVVGLVVDPDLDRPWLRQDLR